MRITVFGASGKVGQLVVKEALKRGHKVVAFVHNSALEKHKNLRVIKGDIYNTDDVDLAMKGSDAVISALGSWGTSQKNVVSKGIKNIIPAMQKQKISRIISLTGHGANAPGDKFDPLHIISRWILVVLAPKILRDGEEHIESLAESNLDWTVIRSSLMEEHGNPHKFTITTKRPLPLAMIHRQAVATCLVDLAETMQYNKQAPFILRKNAEV